MLELYSESGNVGTWSFFIIFFFIYNLGLSIFFMYSWHFFMVSEYNKLIIFDEIHLLSCGICAPINFNVSNSF